MNVRKRIEWIDMAKGLGIILVICGHLSSCPIPFKRWLYSFHMPLFFFLAGITFNYEKYKEIKVFLNNKLKTLFVPYFIFAGVSWLYILCNQIIAIIRNGDYGKKKAYEVLSRSFVEIFFQNRACSYAIGIWFIPCIFLTFCLLQLLCKLFRNSKELITVGIIIMGCFGAWYSSKVKIILPWGLDAAFVAIIFMGLAYVNQEFWKLRVVGKKALLVGLLVNIIFTYFNKPIIDMWGGTYGNFLYFLLQSGGGIIFAVAFSKMFSNKIIQNIGRNSIYYYGIHVVVINILNKILAHISILNKRSIVLFGIELSLTILIIYICNPIYDKIKGFILGTN